MDLWLRAFDALVEDQAGFPSSYMAGSSQPSVVLVLGGYGAPFWPPWAQHLQGTHTGRQNTYTESKNKSVFP